MDLKSTIEKLRTDLTNLQTCPSCGKDMTQLDAWIKVEQDIIQLELIRSQLLAVLNIVSQVIAIER